MYFDVKIKSNRGTRCIKGINCFMLEQKLNSAHCYVYNVHTYSTIKIRYISYRQF